MADGAADAGGTRVLPTTRVLAAVIVPFLVVAWGILYLRPEDTERLFAWPVGPPMTAMMLGAVYLGGAYFFVRVVRARTWEEVAAGFLPVAGFATLMGVATILHWDVFTAGHISFHVWAVLYFTTPFLVVAAWWVNRRVARSEGPGGPVLSGRAQAVAGGLGVVAILVALTLFLWPEQLQQVWPWTLSPLTARVMAAMFVLGGAGVAIARDPRWHAVRLLVQVTWVMLGLILLAAVLAWGDVDPGNVLTWVFLAWLVLVLAGSAFLYGRLEGTARSRRPTPEPRGSHEEHR